MPPHLRQQIGGVVPTPLERTEDVKKIMHEATRRTVLYCSADGQRRRTYPVMLTGEPADILTAADGTVLHKTLMMSVPNPDASQEVESFAREVSAANHRREQQRAIWEAA